MPGSTVAGLYNTVVFSLERNRQTVLCSGCVMLHPHRQRVRVLLLPTPAALGTVSALDSGHSHRCAVVSPCGRKLFSWWHGMMWRPVHVLICPPCVVFVQVFSPSFNQGVFLFLSCKSSSCILNNSPLSAVFCEHSPSQSVVCLLSFSWYCLLQNRSFEF